MEQPKDYKPAENRRNDVRAEGKILQPGLGTCAFAKSLFVLRPLAAPPFATEPAGRRVPHAGTLGQDRSDPAEPRTLLPSYITDTITRLSDPSYDADDEAYPGVSATPIP